MGVGSLFIFFTRPGLIELSNLTKDTHRKRHHKLNFGNKTNKTKGRVMPLKRVFMTS